MQAFYCTCVSDQPGVAAAFTDNLGLFNDKTNQFNELVVQHQWVASPAGLSRRAIGVKCSPAGCFRRRRHATFAMQGWGAGKESRQRKLPGCREGSPQEKYAGSA